MKREFDPVDFDRRLSALVEIAASQSQSIHEMAESVKAHSRQIEEQGKHIEAHTRQLEEHARQLEVQTLQIQEQTLHITEHGRWIDRQIDAIIGLAKENGEHHRRLSRLERRNGEGEDQPQQ
jgi:uncharacterized coiled-coil protein SlyX